MKITERIKQLIRAAVEEDLGSAGDITSATMKPGERAEARLVARQAGVISGLDLVSDICAAFEERLSDAAQFTASAIDGDMVESGSEVGVLRASRSGALTIERTMLNFLGRMSGVATLTRQFVDAAHAANPDVLVMDTRKTIPGWRELDKYAVRCGGGTNHRDGLHDAILIKDNHLAGVPTERLASTLFDMLNRVDELPVKPKFVEVEVDNLTQFEQVCRVLGVNIVLLDNFSGEDLRRAVEMRDALGLSGKLALEASGGVTLETIADIAATGVDRISVGALTHSAPALDIGLDV